MIRWLIGLLGGAAKRRLRNYLLGIGAVAAATVRRRQPGIWHFRRLCLSPRVGRARHRRADRLCSLWAARNHELGDLGDRGGASARRLVAPRRCRVGAAVTREFRFAFTILGRCRRHAGPTGAGCGYAARTRAFADATSRGGPRGRFHRRKKAWQVRRPRRLPSTSSRRVKTALVRFSIGHAHRL